MTAIEREIPIEDPVPEHYLPTPRRIVVGYTNDQEGQDIRNDDVVRPANRRWTKQDSTETHDWKMKSSGHCPTYGSCDHCYKAGPAGKDCKCTYGRYQILFYNRHVIDSITVAELIGEELEVAKADRMQAWIRTPMMQWNSDCCGLAIERKINANESLSADAKKALKMQRKRAFWSLQSDVGH